MTAADRAGAGAGSGAEDTVGREEKGRQEWPGREGWDEDDTTGATAVEMAETRVGKGSWGTVTAAALLT